MNKKITMRYPTAWHQEMWREGAPFGNGIIGGMVYGGILRENILINHALLWRGGRNMELPDISYTLPEIRRLLDDRILLLPALPGGWKKCHVKGLCAKGNVTVDIYVENGLLEKAVLHVHDTRLKSLTVSYSGKECVLQPAANTCYEIESKDLK